MLNVKIYLNFNITSVLIMQFSFKFTNFLTDNLFLTIQYYSRDKFNESEFNDNWFKLTIIWFFIWVSSFLP